MSGVWDKNGNYKTVKNLGWLLRNWAEVESFEVTSNVQSVFIKSWGRYADIPESKDGRDCVLIAYLRDGRQYVTRWADHTILLDWLHRPVFYGLKVKWYGWTCELNKDKRPR